MARKTATWLKMMFYENRELSLTRVLAISSWILFAIMSIYLMVTGTQWSDYSTFAMLTGGGGAITQICNKYTNSKYNTEQGSFKQKQTT